MPAPPHQEAQRHSRRRQKEHRLPKPHNSGFTSAVQQQLLEHEKLLNLSWAQFTLLFKCATFPAQCLEQKSYPKRLPFASPALRPACLSPRPCGHPTGHVGCPSHTHGLRFLPSAPPRKRRHAPSNGIRSSSIPITPTFHTQSMERPDDLTFETEHDVFRLH